jgi:hypothetical protein
MASVSEVDAGTVVTVSALTTATSLKAAPTAALSMRLRGLAGSYIHGTLISNHDLFIQGKDSTNESGSGLKSLNP